jgi:hypothetical protein
MPIFYRHAGITNDVVVSCGVIKSKEDLSMKMQEIRKIAVYWGVDTKIGRFKKDIIKDIQIKEGNSPCFGTKETCENHCMWKADCLSSKQ